jgi:hypothetical protein
MLAGPRFVKTPLFWSLRACPHITWWAIFQIESQYHNFVALSWGWVPLSKERVRRQPLGKPHQTEDGRGAVKAVEILGEEVEGGWQVKRRCSPAKCSKTD